MQRILVVPNQTLGGEHLLEQVTTGVAAGPCRFHIVVPATRVDENITWNEGEAVAVAQRRLDEAPVRFGELGAEVTGEVGDRRDLPSARFRTLMGECTTGPWGTSRRY